MVATVTDLITLTEGQVVVLPQQTHQIIHATNGVLWITQEGTARDILLHAGEEIALASGGMIVIQSLHPESTFRITPTRRSLGTRLRAWLDRMAEEARDNPIAPTLAVAIAAIAEWSKGCPRTPAKTKVRQVSFFQDKVGSTQVN